MLHVTDDMDELFRRAAEDYPLKTDSADWEELKRKMNNAPEPKKNNDKPYRNLLLLLLLLLIPLKILFDDIRHPASSEATGVIAAPAPELNSKRPQSQLIAATTVSYPVVANGSTKSGKTKKALAVNEPGGGVSSTRRPSRSLHMTVPSPEQSAETSGPTPPNTNENKTTETNGGEYAKNIAAADNTVSSSGNVTETSSDPIATADKKEAKKSEQKTTETAVPVKKDKEKKKPVKHFYAGIVAGPDVSTVKLQSVKKAGFGYGLVAGYRLNERFSVETGLLVDKKYYNTDGKYFSTKNIPLPNYVKIDYAAGSCDMFEIPLSIKYNFRQKRGSGWFVSAGISSYLMTKEDYDYDITRYGVTYTRNFTYNESRNSFMSVVSVGGGYSRKLGNIGDLRIEPYFKLPVKKVGIGSLPLQSAGIYFSLTRPLF